MDFRSNLDYSIIHKDGQHFFGVSPYFHMQNKAVGEKETNQMTGKKAPVLTF